MRIPNRFLTNKCVRICSILTLITLFSVEIISYYLNQYSWNTLDCKNKINCTKLLLVGDPQLIGKHNENKLLSPLAIYDSDSYLMKTYHHAYQYAKPDLVIFLGDLLDEGSTATNTEFYEYVRRLFNIFLKGTPENLRHIWLPGDNDIGGEGYDYVTKNKLDRFDRAFSQPDIINFKHILFYKINRITNTIPITKYRHDFYNPDKLVIGLSHIPLLFAPSMFVDKVLTKLQPHLLFTAHEHKSMIVNVDATIQNERHIIPVMPEDKSPYVFDLGKTDMYEIVVPTCSYRMGTPTIGYGFAIIENSRLTYTVLWSPSRFWQLKFYFFFVLFIVLCLSFKCFIRCKRVYK